MYGSKMMGIRMRKKRREEKSLGKNTALLSWANLIGQIFSSSAYRDRTRYATNIVPFNSYNKASQSVVHLDLIPPPIIYIKLIVQARDRLD
jgi:hypothetical protein